MQNRTIAVVSAGLREPSSTRLLADRLAAATSQELQASGVRAELKPVDVRDHAHDIVNHLLAGFPSPALKKVLEAVTGADGLIAVTPVFKASYNGLFKSFIDLMDDTALVDLPVLLGATGGTARHSLALEYAVRPLFAYLKALPTPTAVFAAPEDWAGTTADAALSDRITRAARELAAEVARREPRVAVDPFALTTSFDELLSGN
jgi:FMN reductase